ncbi:hypothetical protein I8751_21845 [Nostocaceae cyanobacterium CENA357]|uniref:Uncharacterized protein n=1 Tax=Atlanticothrix silvestris CENA357 TaxID=1725252 RepID=A0A8J7HH40_9CYAN|nr:hypothetical protein [Atlanticothrix silvestris]MBH8554941.1 hypothetical protein [Atlanticothrix silvestris CENA357]
MTQIKVLNLDNACSLSELSSEDINIVRGGYIAVFTATRNAGFAYAAYAYTLMTTGDKQLARAASLSTTD